jgi:O-Antigen ligase
MSRMAVTVDLLPVTIAQTRTDVLAKLATGTVAAAVIMLPLITPTGPANLGPVDPLIIAGIITVLLWAASTDRVLHAPYALAMGMSLFAGALGALNGPVPELGAVALVQDLVLLIWCAAIVTIGQKADALRTLVRAWAGASIVWAGVLVVAVSAGVTAISGQTVANGSRAALTFGDPNVAANYFCISLMIVWASRWPRNAVLRWVGYLLLLSALALTGSNGGILAVSLAGTVALIAAAARHRGVMGAIAAVAGFAVLGTALWYFVDPNQIQSYARQSNIQIIRDGIGRSGSSATGREFLLAETMALYVDAGALGRGPLSTKAVLAQEQAPEIKEAHNDYAAAIVERGVLGALAILLLLGSLVVRSLSVGIGKLQQDVLAAVPRPSALVGAIVGCLIAGMFYEVLHFRHVWAAFAIVAATYLGMKR